MNKLLLFIASFISLSALAQTEKSGNVFVNTADAAKMALAKQKLYAGDYIAALNAYREVENNEPANAGVKYYVGYCYYVLKQYDKARESLLKALEINKDVKPETHMVLGKVYQVQGEYDKAIDAFSIYKSLATEKEFKDNAAVYLSQCQNAKSMMAYPLSIEVMNLGSDINSKYDDKNPCITADARKMVFTTRRPETTGDQVDTEGDGRYFENIYIAAYDSAGSGFGKAVSVGKPVNTRGHDACTSISPDGRQIFIYKNDINDKESRGGNVFVSKISNGKWRAPESVGKPINSSYWEGGACVSPNGKMYFFTSEREGGFGSSDIWMVERINKKEWGKPVNLGPEINTPFDEAGMFLAPDGKTLFFCSNGPLSMGDYDVLKTVYENGRWGTPVNVGYPINTPAKEGQLTLSADARYAYISSDRKGGLGENDIYKIDLKDYAILEKNGQRKTSNGLSILRGTIREGFEGYAMPDVEIELTAESGEKLTSATTNENGEYFFTLHGGAYVITINKKGFKSITEKITVSPSTKETMVIEKGYLLKK